MFPTLIIDCVVRGKSAASSMVANMEGRVPHPRMITKAIEYHASDTGPSAWNKNWGKADIDLHGTTLTLSHVNTSVYGPARKRKLATFRIARKMLCTHKSGCLVNLTFPDKGQRVHLKFRNEFCAVAWRALLTAATVAGSAGLDKQAEQPPGWVILDSGIFQPANKADKDTWTLK